jgi:enoyl-CoA hydratase/carnithine racemase
LHLIIVYSLHIGFFPDVGSVYHLLQTPEHFGTYLALTGDIINATDMIAATLADYHIVSSSNDLCFLMAETDLSEDSLTAIFEAAHIPPNQNSFYLNNKPSFNKIFDGYRLPKIMASLKDLKDDFAKRTLALIEGASPISVLVAAEHLRRSQNLSLDEILAVDLHLAGQFIQNYDLYEGIRAKMIEKDNLPQWEIADMKTIDNNQVQSYFET